MNKPKKIPLEKRNLTHEQIREIGRKAIELAKKKKAEKRRNNYL